VVASRIGPRRIMKGTQGRELSATGWNAIVKGFRGFGRAVGKCTVLAHYRQQS
jgi:hypothetical protein